jgi:hypothetical protein
MTAGSRVVTVTGTGFTFSAASYGTPIVVQDTLNPIANGVFAIDTASVPSSTNFSYIARAAATTSGSIFDTFKTQVSQATFYTNAAIGGTPTITSSGNKVTVTTTIPHGLSLGNEIQVTGTTAATSTPPNGTWLVSQITSPTTFSFFTSAAPVGAISGGTIYVCGQGTVLHRPFDGGVIFSSNGQSNYESQVRQTRRYFRYQSGKGLQFSSGTILKPNFQLDGLSYSQSTGLVTVTTKDQHNVQPGSSIVISGANESFFNGTFTLYSVAGYNTFTYTPVTNPGVNTVASGVYYASIVNWFGAVNRLGIFDQQNGLFFEFDGQTLYAVRRNSTYQISGRVSVNSGSATVTQATGFTTTFSKQLAPGDYIVLRGQSYRVDSITSDTSMTISPAYRGSDNVVAAPVTKTIDLKIPQSQWNLDKMDGSGSNGTDGSSRTSPSGYVLDLSRMQMFYIDYSWYGAGFIRWGIRGTDGDVTYVHKLANNNTNFEAYMRSGNLPGRYESITQPPLTTTTAAIGASDTSILVANTTDFPNAGTLTIKSASTYENVNYTGKTASSFTGLTRAKAGAFVNLALTATTTTAGAITTTTDIILSSLVGVAVGQTVVVSAGTGVLTANTVVASINTSNSTIRVNQVSTTNFVSGDTLSFRPSPGSNVIVNGTAFTAAQVGQRVISYTPSAIYPDGTFITSISGDARTLTLSQALSGTAAAAALELVPMSATSGQSFAYSTTAPVAVELAYPTFAPTISHWGTSVIMDGRFDDDKSLLFTYGQTTVTNLGPTAGTTAASVTANVAANTNITIPANLNVVVGQSVSAAGGTITTFTNGCTVTAVVNSTTIQLSAAVNVSGTTLTFTGATSKALFSIRVAPSVDNGRAAAFGQRDLINRMQLVLRALDIALQGSTFGNLLVTAVLNGVPSTNTAWTSVTAPTSSLAQIADFSGRANGNITVVPAGSGEVTGGFFVNGTNSVDLSLVRDLGNSILGGGTAVANTGIYPDGPDVLTIVVQNLTSTQKAEVVGRLSWTEAQA